ncbi:MAG: VOC family protein [Burkholderiaceae bacterium]
MIHAMNHFTVTAGDRARTLAYYCELLGLQEGPRPDLGFAGAWLYAGGTQAVLHLYFDRPLPAQRTGVIDHLAFSARGLSETKARFEAAGVPYQLRRQKESGIWQLFSHDPNGARVELDFDPAESP